MLMLTKREQRVVIIVVMLLIGGALVNRYRNTRAPVTPPKPAPVSATAAPVPPIEEDSGRGD